jgi:hypothetical protein
MFHLCQQEGELQEETEVIRTARFGIVIGLNMQVTKMNMLQVCSVKKIRFSAIH